MSNLISQLVSFLKGMWKYRWFAISASWLVFLIGGVAIYQIPNDFEASARVYVDAQNILKPLLAGLTTVPNIEQQVSIMSRTLLSRPNLERVTHMTDLDINAKTAKDKEEMVDKLSNAIKITQTGREDIYTITYNNESPKLAKDVVQSLLTIFVESSVGDKKQDSDKAVHFIEDQIKGYEEKLAAGENALKEFKIKYASQLPRQGSNYGVQMQEASDALNQAQLDLNEAEQARNAIKMQMPDTSALKGSDTVVLPPNPEIDARIDTLKRRLDDLSMQYTDQHPDIVATKRIIADLEKRKLEESKSSKAIKDPGANYSPLMQQLSVELASADAKIAAMRVRVGVFSARLARLRQESVTAPDIETRLTQLNREYQINKENYEKLVERRDSAKLSGDLSSATDLLTFKVIDPPTVPSIPVGPNRIRLFSLLFGAAIAIGIALAISLGQLRPTFVTQSELQTITGYPVLGRVAMNWTDAEKIKHRRGAISFAFCLLMLLAFYGSAMTALLLKIYV
jgi:polysaccharide chain length determinant protein (PEP-CTERM system associated)